jgi:putative transposase
MTSLELQLVSDAFWDRAVPLLGGPSPSRRVGRPPVESRRILSGILHVLRTGCPWKEVDRAYGAGSTLHRYFLRWARSGVFNRFWESGLAEAEEMEGIAWRWKTVRGPATVASAPGTHRPIARGTRTWHPAVEHRAGVFG